MKQLLIEALISVALSVQGRNKSATYVLLQQNGSKETSLGCFFLCFASAAASFTSFYINNLAFSSILEGTPSGRRWYYTIVGRSTLWTRLVLLASILFILETKPLLPVSIDKVQYFHHILLAPS